MKKITAPMAGTVLKVLVEVDANVSEGQAVILLESMKMEIPIESNWNSRVESILVSVGDFVDQDDDLIILA